MKPNFRLQSFLAIAGSSLLAISSASAQTDYYWDSNSTTAGFGNTTGTWGTSLFWGTSSAGTGATANTTITSADTVNFGTATLNYATQNIGVAAGGVTTGGIIMGAAQTTQINLGTAGNAITIHGGGITKNAGSAAFNILSPVTLGAAQNWTNNSANTLFFNNATALTGSANLGVNGTGFISILGGTNTYSGNITVSGGGQLESRGNITNIAGSFGTGNIAINGGAIGLYFNNTLTRAIGSGAGQVQLTGGISGFSGNSGGTFTVSGMTWGSTEFNPTQLLLQHAASNFYSAATLAGNIDLGGVTRTIRSDQANGLVGGGSGTFSGIISNGGITKEGNGTHIFSGANTYAGGTTINAGTLRFDKITAMPNSGAVTVNTGSNLGIDLGAAGDWTGGTSGVGTLGGLLAGVGGAGTSTVAYNGNVGLNLNLTANTSYAGNIANVGTSLAIIKTGDSTLTYATGSSHSYTGATSVLAGQLTIDGSITGGGAISTVTSINGGKHGSIFQSSTGVISGASSFTQGSSSGTSTLSGNNTYNGGTTLTAGTLSIGHNSALGSGTVAINGGTIRTTDTTARTLTNAVTIGNNFTVGGTGNLTFSNTGNTALGATRTITVANGITAEFAQTFTGAGGITKGSTIGGVLKLSGTSSYTGKTTINDNAGGYNVLEVTVLANGGSNSSIGASTNAAGNLLLKNGTALRYVGSTNAVTDRAFTIDSGTVGHGINIESSGAGTLTFSGGPALAYGGGPTGRYITFGGTNTGNNTFGKAITGAQTINKAGTGKWIFDQVNTYTGATNVTEGTLAVNGSLTATSSVTVEDGGILQGSGTINSSVTIQSGGSLAAGNSIDSLATGTLNLNAGSTFEYEINKDAALGFAGDLTAVTGGLNLVAGSILTISELGAGSWDIGEKLTLISYTGAWNNALFTYLGNTLNDGGTFTYSGVDWLFDYNDTDAGDNFTSDLTGSNFVTMTVAIPEPAAALLGSLGLLTLLRRRRH